ncbi:hypothetical protein EDEG_01632 [Edhazardia aedis USNM 41457]|uniref:Uncharacterized protein n=1 Tax=Edhazardia aedis (strain USNM 41457) TaxID=1003232 RepID=J9D8I7_EDHAE|nr:hypothetical protein EDEG_01632 [Edhazardia aedis USNM 41457]|eukprot:EJW04056.1 hypothetical protein EDEG_01632 [Edhazardia aedis USNM 41457]
MVKIYLRKKQKNKKNKLFPIKSNSTCIFKRKFKKIINDKIKERIKSGKISIEKLVDKKITKLKKCMNFDSYSCEKTKSDENIKEKLSMRTVNMEKDDIEETILTESKIFIPKLCERKIKDKLLDDKSVENTLSEKIEKINKENEIEHEDTHVKVNNEEKNFEGDVKIEEKELGEAKNTIFVNTKLINTTKTDKLDSEYKKDKKIGNNVEMKDSNTDPILSDNLDERKNQNSGYTKILDGFKSEKNSYDGYSESVSSEDVICNKNKRMKMSGKLIIEDDLKSTIEQTEDKVLINSVAEDDVLISSNTNETIKLDLTSRILKAHEKNTDINVTKNNSKHEENIKNDETSKNLAEYDKEANQEAAVIDTTHENVFISSTKYTCSTHHEEKKSTNEHAINTSSDNIESLESQSKVKPNVFQRILNFGDKKKRRNAFNNSQWYTKKRIFTSLNTRFRSFNI